MREILFRGKTVGGDWIEGTPMVFTDIFVQICRPLEYNKTVCPETVGQYTGLIDKNGKKIFEGDLVKGAFGTIFLITYDDCYCGFRAVEQNGRNNSIDYYGLDKIEVIGNIYDKEDKD